MLAALLTTCESGMLGEIRQASQAARSSGVTYDVIFNANGGEGTMSKQSVQFGQTVTLNPNLKISQKA